MLSEEFKRQALDSLDKMTESEIIQIFEKIGSKRTSKLQNLDDLFARELSKYDLGDAVTMYNNIKNVVEAGEASYSVGENYSLAA